MRIYVVTIRLRTVHPSPASCNVPTKPKGWWLPSKKIQLPKKRSIVSSTSFFLLRTIVPRNNLKKARETVSSRRVHKDYQILETESRTQTPTPENDTSRCCTHSRGVLVSFNNLLRKRDSRFGGGIAGHTDRGDGKKSVWLRHGLLEQSSPTGGRRAFY